MIELLVTGTGRCGTQFMAEWLTRSGVPCTHEWTFSYRGWTPRPGWRADSSWLAVPYLGLVAGRMRIVHLVRHPLDVIRSFLGTRHFGPFKWKHYRRRWWQFMALHFGYDCDPPVQQAMRYYLEWNANVERFTIDRLRIEDLPDPDVMRSLGGEPAEAPPVTTNTHRRAQLEQLPRSGHFYALARMAERYGYDPATL